MTLGRIHATIELGFMFLTLVMTSWVEATALFFTFWGNNILWSWIEKKRRDRGQAFVEDLLKDMAKKAEGEK